MLKKFTKNKNAMTIIEVVVVVVVLSVLVGLAYPSLENQIRIVRNREGVQILTSLLSAQLEYHLDNGGYALAVEDLSVEYDGQSSYFSSLSALDQMVDVENGDKVVCVGSIDVDSSGYSLLISEDGEIYCRNFGGNAGICHRMGYEIAAP